MNCAQVLIISYLVVTISVLKGSTLYIYPYIPGKLHNLWAIIWLSEYDWYNASEVTLKDMGKTNDT